MVVFEAFAWLGLLIGFLVSIAVVTAFYLLGRWHGKNAEMREWVEWTDKRGDCDG
jgi:hypothetical protein